MFKALRTTLLISLVLMLSPNAFCCAPETQDMSCGMECVSIYGDGMCAMTTTSQTTACFSLSGGCMSHANDCRCGGDGGF
jgi:hypothetical protein